MIEKMGPRSFITVIWNNINQQMIDDQNYKVTLLMMHIIVKPVHKQKHEPSM
jgi:hypothetical protein